jgi:transcriptional/translational regulatory protein YebC/TACO1
MQPNQEIELSQSDTTKVMRVIEELEELDDVQSVSSNLKISDEAIAELAG